MIIKEFQIKNKSGIHVRPAGTLVKILQPFECEITLKHNGKEYNAKSVLGIMSACIKANDIITIACNGTDEENCMIAITEAIEAGLGE